MAVSQPQCSPQEGAHSTPSSDLGAHPGFSSSDSPLLPHPAMAGVGTVMPCGQRSRAKCALIKCVLGPEPQDLSLPLLQVALDLRLACPHLLPSVEPFNIDLLTFQSSSPSADYPRKQLPGFPSMKSNPIRNQTPKNGRAQPHSSCSTHEYVLSAPYEPDIVSGPGHAVVNKIEKKTFSVLMGFMS